MGKNITSQKRGKGSPTYRAPSFKYKADATQLKKEKGKVVDIVNSSGHSAPLMKIKYDDNKYNYIIAPHGVKVGDQLVKGEKADIKIGNTLSLKNIPEGVSVYNIEITPGGGGKLVRSSGVGARIMTKTKDKVLVKLPSGKQKQLNPKSKATIGVVAGSGRTEKPFLKAGYKFKTMKAKGKYWPIVSGASMNAVDHPLGGGRSSRKGRPTIAPKNAPPGRKVGMIRPRHTGRNK